MALVPRADKFQHSRLRLPASDDSAMMNQIIATHAPDGREIDVKALLYISHDIFNRGIHGPSHVGESKVEDMLDETTLNSGFFDMMELLSFTINKINCEISCKCASGKDAHSIAMGVFNEVTSYAWDAKVALTLAAFALNYGDFLLISQLHLTNPLANGIALLKQLPDITERGEVLRAKFDPINTLISAILDVTKCIVAFKDLPSQFISSDAPQMLTAVAHIPTAAYWTIRSIVACASQIAGLVGMSHEYIGTTMESWELSTLAHKLRAILALLSKNLELCHQLVGERRHIEAYQALVRLFDTPHSSNIKLLRALFHAKDDQHPLFNGSTKTTVSVDVLRGKIVLLLISDLDINHDEISMLEQMYLESRQLQESEQYEVVWVAVVDRSEPFHEENELRFKRIQAAMPWYSVDHPALIDPAVIKYIKDVWLFNKKPLLVVLDPLGKVVHRNAIHMMWIWGSLASPFSSDREESLWKEETWRIELIADSIEQSMINWIDEGKYICLYGGEDMEWIRKFTATTRTVARDAGVALEMLYVGKSNPRTKVQTIIETIQREKLSHTLEVTMLVWFFWVRLESMWQSKVQSGKNVEDDPIMRGVATLLTYDGSEGGWAMIGKGGGAGEMPKGKAETILKAMSEYQVWWKRIEELGFLEALNEHLREIHTPHHCNRLILPPTLSGTLPEKVGCVECGRLMEKFIMYRCCTD